MMKALKENLRKFDVVHVHSWQQFPDIVVHYYAKKYRVPYVLQTHGSLPRIMVKQRLKYIYDLLFGYRVLRDASKVIALSQIEAEQYVCAGVPKEKIAIIPNGIDLSEYVNMPLKNSFKKKFNIPEDKKIILYLGRIHKTKGLDLLVKAYAYLIKNLKHNDAILVMAGPDDGYLAKVKSLSDSLCVSDSMLFTGFINSDDKLKALVDADVFVTTSFYGFPVTFLEACAVGTPIVTTTLGDYLEWINENVGYVTLPTHHMLAEAMYAIISNHELSEKFSWNGQRLVRTKFSLQKVVDKLENIYSEVVNVKYG